MKKLMSILLICCTVFSIFTGCKDKAESNEEGALAVDTEKIEKIEENDTERNYGNTINNMYKKKQAAMYNGYLYFSYNKKLYKGKYNDKDTIEKLNDDNPIFINVYKDHLYYICEDNMSKNQVLVKVDMDGTSNRTVIDSQVKNAIIQNDKLIYITLDGTSKSGNVHTSVKEMDLLNNEIKTINSNDSSMIINENIFINTFKGLDRYIDLGNQKAIPDCNGAVIELLSANDNYIIARIDDNRNNFDNSIYAVKPDGKYIKVLEAPSSDEIDSRSILVNNKFYYFEGNDFFEYDLDTQTKTKLFEDKYSGELFEFNGIIYVDYKFILAPLYDASKDETIVREKWIEEILEKDNDDKNTDKEKLATKTDISIDEARKLILKEDGNHVNEMLSDETVELKYVGELSKEARDVTKYHWYLNLPDKCYQFEIATNDELDCGLGEYLVDRKNQKVYRFPNQGVESGYLVKDNKKVKEYKYH